MMRFALLTLLGSANGLLRGTGQSKDLSLLLNDMHPAAVSKLLHQVQLRWEESRSLVLENKTDENEAQNAMVQSCQKVASAIIRGSEGDKDKVVEYMQDVCTVGVDEEEKKKCVEFSSGVESQMSDDPRYNREELDLSKFCKTYWAGPVNAVAEVRTKQLAEENAKKAEEEAEREKEEAQKAQEEAAADAKAQEAFQLQDAINKSAAAAEHVAQVEQEVKGLEDAMSADDANATKLLDQARKEEQVASEKEVKAAEAEAQKNAVAEAADAKSEKVEENADSQAPAVQETNSTAVAHENATAADNDDSKAIAAGDALADKIANKAIEKTKQ